MASRRLGIGRRRRQFLKRARIAAAGAIAALGTALACANLIGIEDLSRAPREGGPDPDGTAGQDTSADPCARDPGPNQPDPSTEGASIAPVWLATTAIDFGGDTTAPGLNLDHVCTTNQATSACVFTSVVSEFQKDLAFGVDNAGRGMINTVLSGSTGARIAPAMSFAVGANQWAIGFRLSEYNGQPDDPSVTLQVASLANGPKWLVGPESVSGGIDTATASARAWIHGGKLVAFFDARIALPVRVSTQQPAPVVIAMVMKLHSAVVVADVSSGSGAIGFSNGVFGARWTKTDVVTQLGSVTVDNKPQPVCGLLKSQMCAAEDIMTDRASDNTKFECDAISSGFGFTAAAASVAGVQTDAGALSSAPCACP